MEFRRVLFRSHQAPDFARFRMFRLLLAVISHIGASIRTVQAGTSASYDGHGTHYQAAKLIVFHSTPFLIAAAEIGVAPSISVRRAQFDLRRLVIASDQPHAEFSSFIGKVAI